MGSGTVIRTVLEAGHSAVGVDIDPRAVKISQENAVLNGVSDRYACSTGSVKEILQGNFEMRQAGLVFVNILAPVIIRLFDDGLTDLLLPGGYLILAGILDTQEAEVLAAVEAHGLQFVTRSQINDWVALCVQK